MPPTVYLAEHSANYRLIKRVTIVPSWIGRACHYEKRYGIASTLVNVHHPLQQRIVRIKTKVAALTLKIVTAISYCSSDASSNDDIGSHLPYLANRASRSGAVRVINVSRNPILKRMLPSRRARPQLFYASPQNLNILVDDRSLQEALPGCQRRLCRKSVVAVSRIADEFFVPGQHEKGTAKDIQSEIDVTGIHRQVGSPENHGDLRVCQNNIKAQSPGIPDLKRGARHSRMCKPVDCRCLKKNVGQFERSPISLNQDTIYVSNVQSIVDTKKLTENSAENPLSLVSAALRQCDGQHSCRIVVESIAGLSG